MTAGLAPKLGRKKMCGEAKPPAPDWMDLGFGDGDNSGTQFQEKYPATTQRQGNLSDNDLTSPEGLNYTISLSVNAIWHPGFHLDYQKHDLWPGLKGDQALSGSLFWTAQCAYALAVGHSRITHEDEDQGQINTVDGVSVCLDTGIYLSVCLLGLLFSFELW
ncbi:hypothetical protein J3458_009391 [Metarhizium acridum]|uniref:uncharacterized protein n=1 Tax=Metarhizium acridum TaxID=92637 RepID=UPI001C6A9F72|nr:hypothetical protein J3458_009391 [Metarhizium acridum]